MDSIDKILAEKVFAVLRIQEVDKAKEVINALYDGGIKVVELVIEKPEMIFVIEEITKMENRPLIMAGGIITQRQAQIAIDAGADVIVSPIS